MHWKCNTPGEALSYTWSLQTRCTTAFLDSSRNPAVLTTCSAFSSTYSKQRSTRARPSDWEPAPCGVFALKPAALLAPGIPIRAEDVRRSGCRTNKSQIATNTETILLACQYSMRMSHRNFMHSCSMWNMEWPLACLQTSLQPLACVTLKKTYIHATLAELHHPKNIQGTAQRANSEFHSPPVYITKVEIPTVSIEWSVLYCTTLVLATAKHQFLFIPFSSTSTRKEWSQKFHLQETYRRNCYQKLDKYAIWKWLERKLNRLPEINSYQAAESLIEDHMPNPPALIHKAE